MRTSRTMVAAFLAVVVVVVVACVWFFPRQKEAPPPVALTVLADEPLFEYRGFWQTLWVGGDEVEHYDSLKAMADAADHVVIGRLQNLRLNRQIRGDAPEDLVSMAAVDVVVSKSVSKNAPSVLTLEFTLAGGPQQSRAALAALVADLPTAPFLFFIREKGGREQGLTRLVCSQGLLSDTPGGVRAPLRGDDVGPFAAELTKAGSIENVARVLEESQR